ncbi:protein kinase [Streptomyces sp. NPDC002896]|uniref:serine/threonine-protein kinase n=1 Tax=Streptomyces sp. NPDC002896 TaxID=3154438 RepID=UPI0033330D04
MAGETPDHGEGRVINGRYRLLRTLGAGGMGRVWLAYDEELACEVSMKEIAMPDVPMDASEPAQRIARARSEARHAARLRGHPHVATVHDVLLHEGLPWIVMEYVPDAVDLGALVRRSGPRTPEQTARIGLAVLDALTAGHRIGILHRDVKPANILLAPDASGDPHARVLLTDYGIALQPESREPRLTATAGILGTPGYLAPERARGEPPTPAADLFSLGATLYQAVEGRGPFDRNDEYSTLTALLTEDPHPPQRAGQLAPVLHGLLIKDPVRRSAPEAVARGLERVLQGPAGGFFGPPPVVTPVPGSTPGQGGWAPGPTPDGSGHAVGHAAGHASGYGSGPRTPVTPGPVGAGTPQTPQSAPAAQTPHTPQTPASGPSTPGGPQVGAPMGTPFGSSAPAQGGASGYEGWNPYAVGSGVPGSPYSGSGSPYSGVAGPQFGGPGQTGGPGGPGPGSPGPGGPGGPRRRLPAASVVAIVIAVVLSIGTGTWAALSFGGGGGDGGKGGGKKDTSAKQSASPSVSDSPTGPAYPYGEKVGLTKRLQVGDCVNAVWSGDAFKSVPNLGVVDCAEDVPDGQVVAVDIAKDYDEALSEGARRCEQQTEEIATAMPDAGSYALKPAKDGFVAAGGGTVCLVLGRHVPIGGEVGKFRDAGTNLWVSQMSMGDCWNYVEEKDTYKAPLVDCAQPHTDQVIGMVPAPDDMEHKKALDNANKLCQNKFESTWASGAELAVYGWIPGKDDWDAGFTKAVCTVGRADGEKTSGKIPAPGAV